MPIYAGEDGSPQLYTPSSASYDTTTFPPTPIPPRPQSQHNRQHDAEKHPHEVAPVPIMGGRAPQSEQIRFPSAKPTVILFLRHCGCPCKFSLLSPPPSLFHLPCLILFPLSSLFPSLYPLSLSHLSLGTYTKIQSQKKPSASSPPSPSRTPTFTSSPSRTPPPKTPTPGSSTSAANGKPT